MFFFCKDLGFLGWVGSLGRFLLVFFVIVWLYVCVGDCWGFCAGIIRKGL